LHGKRLSFHARKQAPTPVLFPFVRSCYGFDCCLIPGKQSFFTVENRRDLIMYLEKAQGRFLGFIRRFPRKGSMASQRHSLSQRHSRQDHIVIQHHNVIQFFKVIRHHNDILAKAPTSFPRGCFIQKAGIQSNRRSRRTFHPGLPCSIQLVFQALSHFLG